MKPTTPLVLRKPAPESVNSRAASGFNPDNCGTSVPSEPAGNPAGKSRDPEFTHSYLAVQLGHVTAAIGVLHVRELLRPLRPAPVSQLPAYVRGTIELHGRTLPVIDLRLRFGFSAEPSERTCFIVVQPDLGVESTAEAALVVDGIEGIVVIAPETIETPARPGTTIPADCLAGWAQTPSGPVALFDLARLVDAKLVHTFAHQAPNSHPLP